MAEYATLKALLPSAYVALVVMSGSDPGRVGVPSGRLSWQPTAWLGRHAAAATLLALALGVLALAVMCCLSGLFAVGGCDPPTLRTSSDERARRRSRSPPAEVRPSSRRRDPPSLRPRRRAGPVRRAGGVRPANRHTHGPSGSGKTTLLNLVGALREPQQGGACRCWPRLRGRRARARRRATAGSATSFGRQPPAIADRALKCRHVSAGRPASRTGGARARPTYSGSRVAGRDGQLPRPAPAKTRQRVGVAGAGAPPAPRAGRRADGLLDRAAGRAWSTPHLAPASCAIILVTHDTRISTSRTASTHMEDGRLVNPGLISVGAGY